MKVVLLLDPIINSNELTQDLLSKEVKEADTAALEVAHYLKSAGHATNIWAVSIIGPENDAKPALSFCLSLEVDSATEVICDVDQLWDKRGVAVIIKQTIESFRPDLILCGSNVNGNSPVGSVLASLLGYTFITGVSSLMYNEVKSSVVLKRYLGQGYQESIESDFPLVLGIDGHIGRPRVYPKLKSIRAAARAPIEKIRGESNPLSKTAYKMSFIKREPYRIPVLERTVYPSTLSSNSRIRYLMGQKEETKVTSSFIVDEIDQGINRFIGFLDFQSLK